MQKSIKKNLLSIICFAFAIFLAFAIALCVPKDKVIAEDYTGFAVSEYATVETNDNGDKLLKFKTTVGSDFLTENESATYTFGTLIYPTDNGSIDTSKTLAENEEILDSVNIVAKNNKSITESFTYNASILFDKETLISWILSQKPELEGDEEGLETALSKVYENLFAKNFTAVSYAVTNSGIIYSSNQSTSVTSTLEYSTEGVVYKIVGNSYAEVTDYTGTATDVVIASQYQGYPVTSIGYEAFYSCSLLTSIEIPNSVTSIGNRVFYNCSSLTSIEIPNSVTSIGGVAFYNCGSLDYNVKDNLKYLGNSENLYLYLAGTTSTDITSATIDSNCRFIGSYAFDDCDSLTSIEIPDSVTGIGSSAFEDCDSLTSIEIPNSVTSIGSSVFNYCDLLTTVTFEENSQLMSIGKYAFQCCRSLTSIEIPNSVTSIGDYAFYDCDSLTSIEIPNTVTSIGESAFYHCSSLTSIEIPNNVTSIGSSSFSNCSLLKNVIFGENSQLISIDNSVFNDCSSLTSIKIPNSVTSIGDDAFNSCVLLRTVAFGGNSQLINISNSAFYNCRKLTSIEIPNTVTSIGSYAFSGCSLLTSITIPNNVTSIGDYAFYHCDSLIYKVKDNLKYLGNSKNPYLYLANTTSNDITSATIDSNCRFIGSDVFAYCSLLISIKIPNSVTSMGESAFYKCSKLTTVTFEENSQLMSIGKYAFSDCSSLTSIKIPNSVTSIGGYAFQYCSSLQEITIPFVGATLNGTRNTHFGYIFGASSRSDNYNYVPTSLKTVIITGGTSIDSYAFYKCNRLTSVEIPNSVTSIGESAFYWCDSLRSITFSDTSTWYMTDNETNWRNKTGGTRTNVTKPSTNATYFKSTYDNYYYWYKL